MNKKRLDIIGSHMFPVIYSKLLCDSFALTFMSGRTTGHQEVISKLLNRANIEEFIGEFNLRVTEVCVYEHKLLYYVYAL